jgi:hypothetical protein
VTPNVLNTVTQTGLPLNLRVCYLVARGLGSRVIQVLGDLQCLRALVMGPLFPSWLLPRIYGVVPSRAPL